MPDGREIIVYAALDGKEPFNEWLNGIKDTLTRARIRTRIDRLTLGLYGDVKPLAYSGGLSELRLNFGSGYRVYFADYGPFVVVLLCGGTKRTQKRDIETAKGYWKDYKERKND